MTLAGVTLEDLAARSEMTLAEARALVAPFLEAGIVALGEDGRLELVDRDVLFAIVSEAAPE